MTRTPNPPPRTTQPAPLGSLPGVSPSEAPGRPGLATVPAAWRSPQAAVAAAAAVGAAALAAGVVWGWQALAGAAPWWAAGVGAALGAAAATAVSARALRRLAQSPGAVGEPGAALLSTPLGMSKPLFLELAGREWTRARRYGHGAALLVVDIDRFARLAEARGNAACDAVMAEMLKATAPTLRGADLLTRLADHQMAVFLAHSDPTGALDVAERIRERTEQMETLMHQAEGGLRKLRVTVSVGVAQLRPAHLSLQAVVDDAQDAVLAARQAGGNCVRAAPVELDRFRASGGWRDDHRARPQ